MYTKYIYYINTIVYTIVKLSSFLFQFQRIKVSKSYFFHNYNKKQSYEN